MEKFVKILKKIKIKNIILLIFLLIFNTYAWFLFVSKVSSGLAVHVSAWSVEFTTNEGAIESEMVIEVDTIYPGMETFEQVINVTNRGEIKAELEYEIKSLTIMGESFVVDENITQEELEEKIKTEYPFKINVEKEQEQLVAGTGPGYFKVTVEWPFESGDDELDTTWGNKAYEYYAANPDGKSIEIAIKLIAKQIEE